MSMGLEILGVAMSIIGCLNAVVSCALPMWKVTAFIGNNTVVAQIIWEGRWMNCVVESTGQMQCKVYDSLLELPQDLQAAQSLMAISMVIAVPGVLISIIGAKCTNCVQDKSAKAKFMIASGVIFIVSGLLTLISVFWSANAIICDFYNPLVVDAQKRVHIGWVASALLVVGGAMLICTCPPQQEKYPESGLFSCKVHESWIRSERLHLTEHYSSTDYKTCMSNVLTGTQSPGTVPRTDIYYIKYTYRHAKKHPT